MEMTAMIVSNHIKKTFLGNEVLSDITFHINEGEIFGLLGPSGSGKTTLIKILTGQLKPSSGQAMVLGDFPENLMWHKRREIGIMMDEFGLYERLSCYENLNVFAKLYNISRHEIIHTLELVGLAPFKKQSAYKLSKGMKSRLRLARTFLTNPKVMFLDEPTSGLDPATMEEIHAMILERKKLGSTIFLTTHNMSEAQNLCDNIALLNKGHIIETGVPREVCRKYNRLKQISIHLTDGRDIVLPSTPESATEIYEFISQGLLETIHSSEPNLETVFLELTGEKLNV